jgi:energy-coupling factor transport system permease protein
MTLRFVPKFKEQMRVVANAQKCIGRDVTGTSMLQRAKNGVSILSIMVTWALENAVETADSMKSRGYGLKGRTSFSIYTFDLRDKRAMIAISLLGIYVAVGKFAGGLYFRYFPTIKSVAITPYSISLFFAYFALCMLPIIIEIREAQNWKSIKSKI